MSINVEMIGETLMIQHYIGEITEPHLCRMVSFSDAFSPNGRTKVHVLWELSVKPINSTRCEYTNSVTATPTEEFLDFIKRRGISFGQAPRPGKRPEVITIAAKRHCLLKASHVGRSRGRPPFEGSSDSWRGSPVPDRWMHAVHESAFGTKRTSMSGRVDVR